MALAVNKRRLIQASAAAQNKGAGGGPALGPTAASFTGGSNPGTLIANFTGLQGGETVSSIAPNDGRMVLASGGTSFVVGLSASALGSIPVTFRTSLGRTLSTLVNVSAPASLYPPLTERGYRFDANTQLVSGTEAAIDTAAFTVTRSGNAWMRTSSGIVLVAANTLRFNEFGLLIEASDTFVGSQPSNIANAAWIRSGTAGTTQMASVQTDGPDGQPTSASRLSGGADGATATQAITASGNYSLHPWIRRPAGGGTGKISFSLDAGVTWTDHTPTENSWIEVQGPINLSITNPTIIIRKEIGTDTIDVFHVRPGTQKAYMDTPVVGTASPGVRATDVVKLTTPSLINAQAGTLSFKCYDLSGQTGTATTDERALCHIYVDSNNGIYVYIDSTTGRLAVRVTAAGATVAQFLTNAVAQKNDTYKVSLRYGLDKIALSVSSTLNGQIIRDIDAAALVGTPTSVSFGTNNSGSRPGNIRLLEWHWTSQQLTDAQMLAWTGGSEPPRIVSTAGDTYVLPSVSAPYINWQTTINGRPVPQTAYYNGSNWTLPQGVTPFDHLVTALLTPKQYFVDPVNGSDSNSGTSGSPIKSLWRAGDLAAADGAVVAYEVILPNGSRVFAPNAINGVPATKEPTKHWSFRTAGGGTAEVVGSSQWAFPATPDGDGCYRALASSGGPQSLLSSWSRNVKTIYGKFTEIPVLASDAAVVASSGGVYFNSGTGQTTIKLPDGVRPTHDSCLVLEEVEIAAMPNFGGDFISADISWYGGLSAFSPNKSTTARNGSVINGEFGYGGKQTTFEVDALQIKAGYVYLERVRTASSMKDGINIPTAGAGVEAWWDAFDCEAYNSGRVASGSANDGTCNGITSHGKTRGRVIGGFYADSQGRLGHFIEETSTALYRVMFVQTTWARLNRNAVAMTSDASGMVGSIFVEECDLTAAGFSIQINSVTGATIAGFKRGNNTRAGVESLTGSGTNSLTTFTRP